MPYDFQPDCRQRDHAPEVTPCRKPRVLAVPQVQTAQPAGKRPRLRTNVVSHIDADRVGGAFVSAGHIGIRPPTRIRSRALSSGSWIGVMAWKNSGRGLAFVFVRDWGRGRAGSCTTSPAAATTAHPMRPR